MGARGLRSAGAVQAYLSTMHRPTSAGGCASSLEHHALPPSHRIAYQEGSPRSPQRMGAVQAHLSIMHSPPKLVAVSSHCQAPSCCTI
eukprot:3451-Heterococcus_DN1.PRE.1